MKFHSLRSLLAAVTTLGAALLLGSCGGGSGGAGGDGLQGGTLTMAPLGANVTLYAGMPATFTISGGRAPYTITSGDAGILPVPERVNSNQFTVVPNNPGVIDAGLTPEDLPRRTVTLFFRDSTGQSSFGTVVVAQNFLTGYGISITPTNCPAPGGGATAVPPAACAGGTSAIRMLATFNGARAGNRAFRFQVVRGNFALRHPVTGQVSSSVETISDHAGVVTMLLEVPANTPSQLAVVRVIDVATGVYVDHVFVISPTSPSNNLTAVPDEITFTGPLSTICGTGAADVLVFGGVPPYNATSLNPNIEVTPPVSNTEPGRFTIRATNPNVCSTGALVVVTDSRGGRVQITVNTEAGSTDPPPPPTLAAGPSTIALACGQSGSVLVVGGTGGYFPSSPNPNVVAVISGNTVTITRVNQGTSPTSVPIAISDGRTIVTVTATVPATCP